MRNSWKIILSLVLVIAVTVSLYSYYLYNKPHDDMAQQTAEFNLTAHTLIDAFATDEVGSTAKFSNKIVEVTGVVAAKSQGSGGSVLISLGDVMSGVSCAVDSADVAPYKEVLDKMAEGDSVIFRGRCDGMLTDVQLSRCVPISK